jgi:RND family efflux transporter MFP subunit
MINRLLLGACVTVVAAGLTAPAIVSTRGPVTESEPRQVVRSERAAHPDDSTGEARRTSEPGFLGVVVALQSVELSSRFDGTLERLDVQVGDHVKSGATIARLEASLRVAEAEHDRLAIEAEDAAARGARLHLIPELVPREQLVTAEAQDQIAAARLRGSVADLAGKRARTDQLTETLRDARIVAPFEGTIAARYVDAGTTVSRSTPIVRLISPTSLVIRFAVPEEQAAGVAVGRAVIVRVASLELTADGVIESITPEIDAALRMVVVEARLAATGGRTDTIPSGAIARVLVAADAREQTRHAATVNPPISAHHRRTAHE